MEKLNKILLNINGKPFIKEGDTPLKLKDVCIESLMALTEENNKLSGSEKFKRYELAMKVNEGNSLSIEELALIKESIGKIYAIPVVGAAYKILEE